MIKKGESVIFLDANGEQTSGRVHSYSQAADGTGRIGYYIHHQDGLYWREERDVRRGFCSLPPKAEGKP